MTIQAMPIKDSISQQAFVSLIGQLINGNPDPENPQPPGPWDPVIRKALHRMLWALGPLPDPWAQVALNPQPLPPIFAFARAIAQEVIDRAVSIREVTDAQTEGDQRGIIIVGGYISRFVDDYCGNEFRLKWPFPGPRPYWFVEKRGGADLIVTGVQFARAASETFDGQLRQTFADAGAKIVQAGVAKMQ